jgi:hypothetical protein
MRGRRLAVLAGALVVFASCGGGHGSSTTSSSLRQPAGVAGDEPADRGGRRAKRSPGPESVLLVRRAWPGPSRSTGGSPSHPAFPGTSVTTTSAIRPGSVVARRRPDAHDGLPLRPDHQRRRHRPLGQADGPVAHHLRLPRDEPQHDGARGDAKRHPVSPAGSPVTGR